MGRAVIHLGWGLGNRFREMKHPSSNLRPEPGCARPICPLTNSDEVPSSQAFTTSHL